VVFGVGKPPAAMYASPMVLIFSMPCLVHDAIEGAEALVDVAHQLLAVSTSLRAVKPLKSVKSTVT
jgi:hypothetical protein